MSGDSALWQSLGLLGILALWGAVALVPWAAAHLATRGRLSLVALPLAFAAGIGSGALVPALGGKDLLGFGVSLASAVAMGAFVSTGALQQTSRLLRKERS